MQMRDGDEVSFPCRYSSLRRILPECDITFILRKTLEMYYAVMLAPEKPNSSDNRQEGLERKKRQ